MPQTNGKSPSLDPVSAGTSSKETILIIDDAAETRYAIARYLHKAGFDVVEASDGQSGLLLAKNKPSLVILDIKLPDMSGFDVAKTLRDDPETTSIPILQVSAAFTNTTDKVEALEGGADGYLTLPVEPEELIATVRALLRLRSAEAAARKLSDQWQGTFDAINHAVCIIDAAGRVERYNQGFVTFLGVVQSDIVGKSLDDCLRLAGVHSLSLSLPLNPLPSSEDVAIQPNTYRISISPIKGSGPVPTGAICVFWDISPYLSYERHLLRENQRLTDELKGNSAELEGTLSRLPARG